MTAVVAPLRIGPSWRSFTGIQGGVLVGRLLAAAAAPGRAPRAVTAHLLRSVAPDVDVVPVVRPDRSGTTGSVRVELRQDGALAVVGQVLTLARPVSAVVEPPPIDRPRVEDGEPFQLPRDLVPIADHTEIRALGRSRPLAGGPEPRLHAWVRIHGEPEQLVRLGVLLDALPPSLFAVWTSSRALPTAELTAHLSGELPAAEEWVRVDQRTTWHDADVAVDDAELRGEDGRLIARARQTRRLIGGR